MTSQPPSSKPPGAASPAAAPGASNDAAARLRERLASLKRPSQPATPSVAKPSQPALAAALSKGLTPPAPLAALSKGLTPPAPVAALVVKEATPPAPVAAVVASAIVADGLPAALAEVGEGGALEVGLETPAEMALETAHDQPLPELADEDAEAEQQVQSVPASAPAATLNDLLAQQATLTEPGVDTLDEEDQEETRIGPPPSVREVPVPRLVPLAALEEFPELASLAEPTEEGGGVEVTRKVDRSLLPSAQHEAGEGFASGDVSDDEATRRSVRPAQLVAAIANDPEELALGAQEMGAPHGELPAPVAPPQGKVEEEVPKGRGRLPRFSEMKVQRVEIQVRAPRGRGEGARMWMLVALAAAAVLLLLLLVLL